MLKIECNNEKCKIEVAGNISTLCADLSVIIKGIDEKLTENDPELGHYFKVMFTKGFMDGLCFTTDREHMEHFLAEGDETLKKQKKEEDPFMKLLDDLINYLQDKNATLEKLIKKDEDEHETE